MQLQNGLDHPDPFRRVLSEQSLSTQPALEKEWPQTQVGLFKFSFSLNTNRRRSPFATVSTCEKLPQLQANHFSLATVSFDETKVPDLRRDYLLFTNRDLDKPQAYLQISFLLSFGPKTA